jgi:hypothetical protein
MGISKPQVMADQLVIVHRVVIAVLPAGFLVHNGRQLESPDVDPGRHTEVRAAGLLAEVDLNPIMLVRDALPVLRPFFWP